LVSYDIINTFPVSKKISRYVVLHILDKLGAPYI
jgi:hypothetical protein